MKRIGREPPRRLLSRAELMRMMSLIFMAVILLMLVQSARNPDLWRGMVGQSSQERVGDDETGQNVERTPGNAPGGKTGLPAGAPLRAATGIDSSLAQATPPASSAKVVPPTPPTKPGDNAPAAKAPAKTAPDATEPDTTAISNGLQPGAAGNAPRPFVPGAETGKANATAENAAPNGQAAAPKAPAIPPATGPTDENLDEQAEAIEDFDAIEDAESVAIQPQEVQAYERIARWVTNQPYARLVSRAKYKKPTFGEFIEAPAHHRELGKLYQFDFHVQRMLKCPDPLTFDHSEDDPHEPVTLYELWGTLDDSHGRPISLIVYDPPKGLPLGSTLRETVHFAGYFFKLLAYEPGKMLPGGKLLKAPVFIGRIATIQRPPGVLIGGNDLVLALLLGGGTILAILFWSGRVLFNRNARNLAPLATERSLPPGVTIDQWLDKAGAGEVNVADDPESAPIVIDDKEAPHATNGHSNGAARRLTDRQDGG